ncbi:hypothetical protein [Actinopolymorpha alba]|uniref:hypothetical protein n=1 Tax=Actinopolymorpha alba TaxID=533267 RepID=UPI00037EBB75|nr:hypothetical protein [Actinopolymorpha alba]
MADNGGSNSASGLPPHAQELLVDTARRIVRLVVAGLTGFNAETAQRNAREATQTDPQRSTAADS